MSYLAPYNSRNTPRKIRTALISVFYKTGLEHLLEVLAAQQVEFVSTGGTYEFIKSKGYTAARVEDLTGFPAILGGRVKTLHPKVFGGILQRREEAVDMQEVNMYKIPPIDLVIVDLYPFDETLASGAPHEAIIEKIDIGGVSLIRAAAKNFKDVAIVCSKDQYAPIADLLASQEMTTSLEQRSNLAGQAFALTAAYDSSIATYFAPESLQLHISEGRKLRYGENPHQSGYFFGKLDEVITQLHGKDLSYNNLLDIDAAANLMSEFYNGAPCVAVLKHNNPCGLAIRPTLLEAWNDALAGDPVSAFGGVIISNKKIDGATAEAMHNLFFEVLLAPEFSPEALELLQQKKNRVLLRLNELAVPHKLIRTALNGFLVQDRDTHTDTREGLHAVTTTTPNARQIDDLIFANKIVKHTRSNTIVLAGGGQLFAAGTGQTSRIDAMKQAIDKALHFGFDLTNAVMASDAFFPFADSVEVAHHAGIKAVIQPGGSVRDQASIDFCNAHQMAMVFTGVRHFKH
jgi:phosphoribosylaminoimidazolecarboxamide formyltransferase/IMP cyclohydrolase